MAPGRTLNFSSYEALAFRRDGKVLNVTMNRPDTLNAVDPVMDAELQRFFVEVAYDGETNVVVITGAGRAFSAGGNIDEMQRAVDEPSRMLDAIHGAKALVFAILDCPKITIAKVNGHAIGLGATLALYCDLVYAADNAKLADPHVKIGYVAGDGGSVIWPQLIGYARAKEYLFTGDTITGADAAKIGLVNHALPLDQLDKAVDEMAQRIANGAIRAIQWTKASVNIGLKQLAHSVMDAGMAYEALSNYTKDHAEAVAAFKEKRTPKFNGN